jgi:antitoxin component YwqK of YwqJK toxin-antitoxin module
MLTVIELDLENIKQGLGNEYTEHIMQDKSPKNEKGQAHGHWEKYYPNGKLDYKGNYINGKRYGYWERYYSHGDLCFKRNYINGKHNGYCEGYHYLNGILCYKEYHAK